MYIAIKWDGRLIIDLNIKFSKRERISGDDPGDLTVRRDARRPDGWKDATFLHLEDFLDTQGGGQLTSFNMDELITGFKGWQLVWSRILASPVARMFA